MNEVNEQDRKNEINRKNTVRRIAKKLPYPPDPYMTDFQQWTKVKIAKLPLFYKKSPYFVSIIQDPGYEKTKMFDIYVFPDLGIGQHLAETPLASNKRMLHMMVHGHGSESGEFIYASRFALDIDIEYRRLHNLYEK